MHFLYGSVIGSPLSAYYIQGITLPGIYNLADNWEYKVNGYMPQAFIQYQTSFQPISSGLIYFVDGTNPKSFSSIFYTTSAFQAPDGVPLWTLPNQPALPSPFLANWIDLSPYNNTTLLSAQWYNSGLKISRVPGISALSGYSGNVYAALTGSDPSTSNYYRNPVGALSSTTLATPWFRPDLATMGTSCTTLTSTYHRDLSTLSAFTVSMWLYPRAWGNGNPLNCNFFPGDAYNQNSMGPILQNNVWFCNGMSVATGNVGGGSGGKGAGNNYFTNYLTITSNPFAQHWVNLVLVRYPNTNDVKGTLHNQLTSSGGFYSYYNAYPAHGISATGGQYYPGGGYSVGLDSLTVAPSTRRTLFKNITLAANQDYYGGVGPIQIWNRALSASEIAQNYNAFSSRFGMVSTTAYVPSSGLTILSATSFNNYRTFAGYQQYYFTSSGTFTVSGKGYVYIAGCAGGGAGGYDQTQANKPYSTGGGGGGGGVVQLPVFLSAGTYTVTIGGGGGVVNQGYGPGNDTTVKSGGTYLFWASGGGGGAVQNISFLGTYGAGGNGGSSGGGAGDFSGSYQQDIGVGAYYPANYSIGGRAWNTNTGNISQGNYGGVGYDSSGGDGGFGYGYIYGSSGGGGGGFGGGANSSGGGYNRDGNGDMINAYGGGGGGGKGTTLSTVMSSFYVAAGGGGGAFNNQGSWNSGQSSSLQGGLSGGPGAGWGAGRDNASVFVTAPNILSNPNAQSGVANMGGGGGGGAFTNGNNYGPGYSDWGAGNGGSGMVVVWTF